MRIFADFHASPLTTYALVSIVFYAGPLMLFEYWLEKSQDMLRLTRVSWLLRSCVYSYMAVMILLFHPTINYEFIYFQF
jgi:hypothetical protein